MFTDDVCTYKRTLRRPQNGRYVKDDKQTDVMDISFLKVELIYG
jgi:hypothetical protein